MKLTEHTHCKCTGIYKITNLLNNKVYIGQSKNIHLRIKDHLRSTVDATRKDYDVSIHRAIRKYGVDAFQLDIVEICAEDKLNEREQYWVAYYDAYNSGYNQTLGGKQSIRYITLTAEQVAEIYECLLNSSDTYAELAERFGIGVGQLYKINSGKSWHNDLYTYPLRQHTTLMAQLSQFNGTAIQQLDLDSGKVLATFRSYHEVNDFLGTSAFSTGISRCCNGTRKSAAGYGWKRIEISKEDWLKL